MSTSFRDFVQEIEQESPARQDQINAARKRFLIGAKLLERRASAGFTQQQLAAASGVPQSEISRIERGQSNPTLETLESLGVPLGITLDYTPLGAPADVTSDSAA